MIVAFDAAGTLLKVHPSVGHVYATHARAYGVHVSPDVMDTAFSEAYARLRADAGVATPFHSSEEVERYWWQNLVSGVFDSAGVGDGFGKHFDAFFEELFEQFADPAVWHTYPDVEPALEALRAAGHRCVVASNWDSRLPRLLSRMSYGNQFDAVYTSADLGYSKPHRPFFANLLARLAVPKEEIVYVGDEFATDIAPARDAGIAAVWLDRKAKDPRHADTIQSLSLLPDLLQRFSA